MLKLMEICNQFKNDSSKLGKQALLKQYKDDERFKRYLQYILEPSYVYGLQDKKLKKYLGNVSGTSQFNDLFEVFEYLLEHNTGTDDTAKKVAQFIDSQDEQLHQFLLESICKKMKLGITAKTVNAVYGKGFITNFEVQLAKKYEDEQHKVKGKFFITEKYDGMRLVYLKKNGKVTAFSRQGEVVTGLIDIDSTILQFPDGVYDGEVLIKTHEQLKDRDVLQETLKITRKKGEKHNLVFIVFDYLTLDEFEDGQSKGNYEVRRQFLETLQYNEYVQLIPILYQGEDQSVIPDLLKDMEDKGREGLMVNISKEPYVCRRTHHLLKIKTMNTADLRIIGLEEGSGKYKDSLGALICNYKGFELKVGSGLTDADRREFFDNQEKYIGKIITVQYFRESSNDKGGLSVSFPVYVCIRDDKTEPSYY